MEQDRDTEERRLGEFKVTMTAYRCRCGHEWISRTLHQTEKPRVCPKCKSPHWDKPYQFRMADRRRPKGGVSG